MKYVHPDYKTKEVTDYIDDLIVNGNVQSFSDLTYKNKCILSAMLLKNEPVTEILNFISQNGHEEFLREFMSTSLRRHEDKDYKEMISDYLHGWAADYYEPIIESILNERLNEISATE